MVTQFNRKDLRDFSDFLVKRIRENHTSIESIQNVRVHPEEIDDWINSKNPYGHYIYKGYKVRLDVNEEGLLNQVLLHTGDNHWLVIYDKDNDELILARTNHMCANLPDRLQENWREILKEISAKKEFSLD